MTKVLFEVDARRPAKLYEKLIEQQQRRAIHGEIGFSMYVDDNARHISYVFLQWESLRSAQTFLESPASHELVNEWPVEEVLGAVPLKGFAEIYESLKSPENDTYSRCLSANPLLRPSRSCRRNSCPEPCAKVQ